MLIAYERENHILYFHISTSKIGVFSIIMAIILERKDDLDTIIV